MRPFLWLVIFCFAASANASWLEHIENGGFETGDFSGWHKINVGDGDWFINDGTYLPEVADPQSPLSGVFDVLSAQQDSGMHVLYQTILLPTSFTVAELSWLDRINNMAPDFADPEQEWRVLLKDALGNLIHEVFSTSPGDDYDLMPNSRSFDVSALLAPYQGQEIMLVFEQQDTYSWLHVSLDDVSLVTAVSAPNMAVLMLLVIGGVGLVARNKSATR